MHTHTLKEKHKHLRTHMGMTHAAKHTHCMCTYTQAHTRRAPMIIHSALWFWLPRPAASLSQARPQESPGHISPEAKVKSCADPGAGTAGKSGQSDAPRFIMKEISNGLSNL